MRKDKMRTWIACMSLFAVLTWAEKVSAQCEFQDIDSIGNLWVVTVDLSGSMIDGGHFHGKTVKAKAQYMANQLALRLIKGKAFDLADFNRDSFLFFTSGYAYDRLRKNAPSFDECFIHHTDEKIYRFSSRDELVHHIHGLLDRSKYAYAYKQSFVSQIVTFSAVKASKFIAQRHQGCCYDCMYVVTLTDDAEGTQQWMNDFKNIKKWDIKKVEEISNVTSRYVYNSLTGSGKGRMTELSADESGHVHVRSYRYELLDAAAQTVRGTEIMALSARDGKALSMKLPFVYKGDFVEFVQIDSLCVNGKMLRVGQRFGLDEMEGAIFVDYDTKRFKNDFVVYGYMQVEYPDLLWGEHLRKVYFEQAASLMPARTIWQISIYLVGSVLLLIVLLWVLLKGIPNIVLLRISIANNNFCVLRCRRSNWKKEGTHLMSCILKEDGTIAPLFFSHLPMLMKELDSQKASSTIVVRSRFRLSFIKDESLRDASLSYASFETDCTTGKGEYIYTLKDVGSGGIAITLPLVGKPLLISVEKEQKRIYKNFPQMMEMSVLQNYLHLRHKQYNVLPRYDAIVVYGRYDNYMYWSVLSPEYDDDIGLPLSQARCLFSFRHPDDGIDDALLQKLRDLMARQIRKEHPEFKKIAAAKVDIAEMSKTFKGDLKIFYPVCGSYLCAVEDVDSRPSMQTLYSPMGDEWENSCVSVSVRSMRTGVGKLRGMFLPCQVLRKAFANKIPAFLWYGVGSKFENQSAAPILNFREDCDCQHIVFHELAREGNRVITQAKTLSFDTVVNESYSY